MKSKVYIETTIVSYLVASPTRDLIQLAHQEITRQWWAERARFDLRHLANAAIRGKIEQAVRDAGMVPPIICTPEELREPTS